MNLKCNKIYFVYDKDRKKHTNAHTYKDYMKSEQKNFEDSGFKN